MISCDKVVSIVHTSALFTWSVVFTIKTCISFAEW